MNQSASADAGILMGLGLIAILFILAIGLAFYLFFCFCAKKICEKCGHEPGVLIWIPIVNLVPLLTVAKLPVWLIILFLIPLVQLVVGVILWWKLCEARGKPAPLALLLLLPPVSIFVPVYLAFSE